MKLYSNKQRWKKFLIILGLAIVGIIFYFTSNLVSNFKKAELEKVQLWSEAIKKKAELVKLTNAAFEELSQNESEKVKLWASATKEFKKSLSDFGFALEIIQNNKNIPLILTDKKGSYLSHKNFDNINEIPNSKIQTFIDSICLIWEKQNPPIVIQYFEQREQKIFYSNSKKYFQLQVQRDSLLSAFSEELLTNIAQLPLVFWSNEGDSLIISNVIDRFSSKTEADAFILEMKSNNKPIKVSLGPSRTGTIYHNNSDVLLLLKYAPLVTLIVIAFFLLISYLSFSSFRKAEQNQVWAGMAKETAHQLGTPLSSLQGWIEILKDNGSSNTEAYKEMEKDINRLTMVSERFSKIGSKVELIPTEILSFFNTYLEYMQKRIPKTVALSTDFGDEPIIARINTPLFSWVIENIMKNAADAMDGNGELKISFHTKLLNLHIMIEDSGKGIPSSMQKTIFEPGYTTKDRGWGLGLSLAKRIIEGHHEGKIQVKSSKKDKGTTMELIIPIFTEKK